METVVFLPSHGGIMEIHGHPFFKLGGYGSSYEIDIGQLSLEVEVMK